MFSNFGSFYEFTVLILYLVCTETLIVDTFLFIMQGICK